MSYQNCAWSLNRYNDGAWTILPQNTSDSTAEPTKCVSKQRVTRREHAWSPRPGKLFSLRTVYVPAYSTRLKYADGAWTILPQNTSDSMGMVDPIWAERNWNTIGVQVYTVQYSAYDNAVLVAGITVTTLAYIGIMVAKSFITKALKQD
ncbi:hypothetical protein HID58_061195 [Brassica napus]|uniref:Nicastrin n=1 Tax=Brassica napus TaxID=3708 RepID=A0ABQ7ZY03_BRANA|nr:hypothetical protein HID58_061195 [Brassica napus]